MASISLSDKRTFLRFQRVYEWWPHFGVSSSLAGNRHLLFFTHQENYPSLPDLSPCDFWLFGFLKHNLKDWEVVDVSALHHAITNLWDALTSEDVHAVSREWITAFLRSFKTRATIIFNVCFRIAICSRLIGIRGIQKTVEHVCHARLLKIVLLS
jgi:hypothetical protein